MKDKLLKTVFRGLGRDFAKPIIQREGFTPKEVRQLILYFIANVNVKLVEFRMAVLLLLLFIVAARFEEAAAIELVNVEFLRLRTSKLSPAEGYRRR
jgi:hypothetical protein